MGPHTSHPHARRYVGAVAVVAATVALAACSSSGSKSDKSSQSNGSSSGSTQASAGVLGTPHVASGSPVTIGLVSDGKGTATDQSSEIYAIKAVGQYANQYLNGMAGHPIKFDVCETKQTPAGAKTCANQMLADKVPVVLLGVSGQAGVVAKAVASAGVPIMTDEAIDAPAFTTPGSFVLLNAVVADFGVPAVVDQKAGIKKAAYAVLDVPAATGGVNTLGKAYFAAAGISLKVVPIPVGTPDLTSQMQSAISGGAKAIHIIGESNSCTAALKAEQSLGFKGPVTVIGQCFQGTPGKGLPNGAEGISIASPGQSVQPQQADAATKADFALFNAVMDKYAKGQTKAGSAPNGYRSMLSLLDATKGLTGAVTSASVKSAIETAPAFRIPLGGGLMAKCDGKAFAAGPGFCTGDGLTATLNKQGQVTKYELVKVDLKLG